MSTTGVQTTPSGTAAVAAPPMVTAKIRLTVEKFHSIGVGPTKHKMELTNPSATATQPSPDLIQIHNGGAKLEFSVVPADFRPVGIIFKNSRTKAKVRNNSKHSPFKKMKLTGNTLEIEDAFPLPPPGQTPSPKKYKFSVLVQRVSNNVVGIIDPEVENEHDTFDNDNEDPEEEIEEEGEGEEEREEE